MNNILLPALALLNYLLPPHVPFGKRTIPLSISTRRWQSCIHRLKIGTSEFPTTNDYWQSTQGNEGKQKEPYYKGSEARCFIFSCYCKAWFARCEVTDVIKFCSADHASEVQVTMMLTESCKLRGLHHRLVEAHTGHCLVCFALFDGRNL